MKITEITYKQNFAYNPIQMEHIHLGVTIEINDDKEAERAFEMAKQMVHETYENIIKNAPVPIYEDYKVPEKQIEKPKMSQEEELIKIINNCTSLDGDNGLLSYRIPASLNPSTKSAYDLKRTLLKK